MASSKPKEIEDSKSIVPDDNSKLKDQTFSHEKQSPQSSTRDGVREQHSKQFIQSKVEEGLRFLIEVFEGDSFGNKKGIRCISFVC